MGISSFPFCFATTPNGGGPKKSSKLRHEKHKEGNLESNQPMELNQGLPIRDLQELRQTRVGRWILATFAPWEPFLRSIASLKTTSSNGVDLDNFTISATEQRDPQKNLSQTCAH